jgi:hypothetical protein
MKLKIGKQKFIIIGVVFILPALMSMMLYKKTAGGHPGRTGAPGEVTCAQSGCHTSSSTMPGAGVNTLLYPNTDSTYIPGTTYTLTVQVQRSTITKFGFELCALKDNDSTNIGQIAITDSNRTHMISTTINAGIRDYITHSTNGTPALITGNTSWSFRWTAPSSNEGKITFYYVSNCTNNSSTNLGDTIYLSSFQIKPKVFTSINEIVSEKEFTVLYNRSVNSIVVNYLLNIPAKVTLHLFDLQGKEISLKEYDHGSAGNCSDRIEVGKDISAGIYNLSLMIDNKVISRKVLVQ